MDPNVVTLIAGLGGTTLGGLIAASAGWWQANRQRGWQVEDFKRTQDAARDAEVRARADEKAFEIQVELDILERLLIPRHVFAHFVLPEKPDEQAALRQAIDRLARAAALLKMPLRRHVEVAAEILPDADQLATGWLQVHPRTVVWSVIGNARDAVNRYLRNDTVPDQLPEPVHTYKEAWEALQADIERQVEQELNRLETESN